MHIAIREIRDCQGKPTVEIAYEKTSASAPSGTSTGKHEVPSFRHSIKAEIQAFKKLIPQIEKTRIEEFEDLKKIESLLKSFGASITIALEYAVIKSKGGYKWLGGKTIPSLLGNCIGGGAHGGTLEFQEFLAMNTKKETTMKRFFQNMEIHKRIQQEIQSLDNSFNNKTTIEGAWAPEMENEQALSLLKEKANELNLEIGLDIAASNFYRNRQYHYKNRILSRDEQVQYISTLIKEYNLSYVEDPLEQEDFDGFSHLTKKNCLICGDDLITTNLERLEKALDFHSINSIIIKPNQIGSLIKTRQVIDLARKNHITPVISHRSRETNDNTLSHLAVGFNIPIFKIGIMGEERTSKIRELIRIENEIKQR